MKLKCFIQVDVFRRGTLNLNMILEHSIYCLYDVIRPAVYFDDLFLPAKKSFIQINCKAL